MSQPKRTESTIRNTTDAMRNDPAEPLLALAVGMATGSGTEFIEGQERSGQAQLVNSDRLPTDTHGTDADFIALGFTFGPPDPNDPLFRPATLPPGWARRAMDHAMGSEIVDQHGRARVSIFYKAAFYDRKADMHLIGFYGYLSTVLYNDATPILDDEWLTREVAVAELEKIAASYDTRAAEADGLQASRTDDYWAVRAAEHRANAEKARALAASL